MWLTPSQQSLLVLCLPQTRPSHSPLSTSGHNWLTLLPRSIYQSGLYLSSFSVCNHIMLFTRVQYILSNCHQLLQLYYQLGLLCRTCWLVAYIIHTNLEQTYLWCWFILNNNLLLVDRSILTSPTKHSSGNHNCFIYLTVNIIISMFCRYYLYQIKYTLKHAVFKVNSVRINLMKNESLNEGFQIYLCKGELLTSCLTLPPGGRAAGICEWE